MRLKPLFFVLQFVLLAACAYTGGADDPGVRKFTLFSMLNGDDIRGKCGQQPGYERYRIVYNGLYEEQFRSYELVRGPRDGHVLKSSAANAANLAEVKLNDLLAPWRSTVSERQLKDHEFTIMTDLLAESGFFKPSPVGLRFASDNFWWLAVGCRGGQIFFQVWLYPETDLLKLPFARPLLAMDGTGVALNPPRHPTSNLPPMKSSDDDRKFNLRVGENGLSGGTRLF